MLQLKQIPRANGRAARTLKWLTLKEIRACYLEGEALIKEGWPIGYFIEKFKKSLLFEQSTYENSEKTERHRWEYERYTKEIRTLISAAEAEVVGLMLAHAEIGKLVLVGRTSPDKPETIIARRLYAFLTLDFETGVVCGVDKDLDITFRGVRGVFQRKIPTGDPILDQIQNAEKRPKAEKPKRGRPTSHPLVLAEHRRRVAAGEHEKQQRAEADFLVGWLVKTHKKSASMKRGAIEKLLANEGTYK